MINSLHVAQTGLNASRTAVEGVMNNISNENTPGYKKRVVELSEATHAGNLTGSGVLVSDIKRITNEYVFNNLMKENSTNSYYNELSSRLADVESLFYETQDSGFSSNLNRYFQSLEDLRSNPTDEVRRNNVINNAEVLVANIKSLYDGLEELQNVNVNAINNDIDIVNGLLLDIGKINQKIGQQIVPPNDLLDRRDALEKELSQYVNIEVDRGENYELKIAGRTAVRHNTLIHDVKLVESYIPQRDKYTTDGTTNPIVDAIDPIADPFGINDKIVYNLNNKFSVSVEFNELVSGDWDDDSTTPDIAVPVTAANITRALVFKINADPDINKEITAFNGETSIDSTTGIESSIDMSADKYLHIKSNVDGTKGDFEGYVSIVKDNVATPTDRSIVYKDSTYSSDSVDDVTVNVYDQPINLTSGSIKAMSENLESTSGVNKFQDYKDRLDSFVEAFVDVHDSFVTKDDGSYLYGKKNVDSTVPVVGLTTVTSIGMFSGSTVSSFIFNEKSMITIADGGGKKLEYLASIQFKSDFDFDGTAQDGTTQSASSFSAFYKTTQVQIASDKENVDYLKDTQSSILNSLEGSYDKLVKVDKDEEMINLIKFQASYEANAKMITVVDEMLSTLLGMKR